MDTKMKSMISNVDHGNRVTALESGFSGLEDSMDQHRNDLNSRMVKFLTKYVKYFTNISYIPFQKAMISDIDHGDRVTALESGFTSLKDSLDQHRNDYNSKMVKLYWIFLCDIFLS